MGTRLTAKSKSISKFNHNETEAAEERCNPGSNSTGPAIPPNMAAPMSLFILGLSIRVEGSGDFRPANRVVVIVAAAPKYKYPAN
jgi:hypothetical protein